MKKTQHRKHAKTVLRLADLEHAKSAVLNSLGSPESRRSYEFAIRNFVEWYCSEPRLALNRIVVSTNRLTASMKSNNTTTRTPEMIIRRRRGSSVLTPAAVQIAQKNMATKAAARHIRKGRLTL